MKKNKESPQGYGTGLDSSTIYSRCIDKLEPPYSAEQEMEMAKAIFDADAKMFHILLEKDKTFGFLQNLLDLDLKLGNHINKFKKDNDSLTLYRSIRGSQTFSSWLNDSIKTVSNSCGSNEWKKRVLSAKTHSSRIKNEFIRRNLRLVLSAALQFTSKYPQNRDDLIQEGNLGLIRAVEGFNPDRNLRFSTYAYWWIRNAMQVAIRDKLSPIRLPSHTVEAIRSVTKLGDTSDMTEEEISAKTGLSQMMTNQALMCRKLINKSRGTVYLDAPISDEDGGDRTLLDIIPNDDNEDPLDSIELKRRKNIARYLFRFLTEKQHKIISERFGFSYPETSSDGSTLREIGGQLGLCRERVRQIESESIRILRHKAFGMVEIKNKVDIDPKLLKDWELSVQSTIENNSKHVKKRKQKRNNV